MSSLFNDLYIDRIFCVESFPSIVAFPKTMPSIIMSRRITIPASVEQALVFLKLSAIPNTRMPLFPAWSLTLALPLFYKRNIISVDYVHISIIELFLKMSNSQLLKIEVWHPSAPLKIKKINSAGIQAASIPTGLKQNKPSEPLKEEGAGYSIIEK